ncbi:hypothetical protein ACIP9H_29305 [Streptomyces sp. NPDC088732]|uniref:hypothetical protein n=1 Tax=Streptomyces sp. NPDC088732 TaxID=3365879 RepID=UPI00380F2EB8
MTAYPAFAAGQSLTAGALSLAALIGQTVFRATRGAGQTITSGTEDVANAIQWDTVDLDLLGGWTPASQTRWTVPFAGWWRLDGSVSFVGVTSPATPGTLRDALWYCNGATIAAGRARSFSGTIGTSPMTVEARSIPYLLNAGDYVQLIPLQNASISVNTGTGTYAPHMTVTYAGPPA